MDKPVISGVGSLACGCDKITYWNVTVAALFGQSVKATGQCPNGGAVTCSDLIDCPHNRFCNRIVVAGGGQCAGGAGQGTCWGLPPSCNDTDPKRYRECGMLGSCDTFCQRILNEKPFYQDGTCPNP